jgi:chaperonin GroES
VINYDSSKGGIVNIGFSPLYDRVLIQRRAADKQIGAIFIPETVEDKPMFGTVVAVGTGTPMKDGSVRALAVKVGDTVMFEKYSGFELELNISSGPGGEKAELVVVKEDEILGVVTNV